MAFKTAKTEEDRVEYTLELESRHMKSTVTNKNFDAQFTDVSNIRDVYSLFLKKEVFIKFFSILKLPGAAAIRANHKEMLEMEYTLDKCHNITVILITPARDV